MEPLVAYYLSTNRAAHVRRRKNDSRPLNINAASKARAVHHLVSRLIPSKDRGLALPSSGFDVA